MSITPPSERIWWKEPIAKVELIWIIVAFCWGLVMFFMMIYWHGAGEQNLSNEAYRISAEDFIEKTTEMVDQYTVREESGFPVVHPP
ncbi:MAG: cytochrome C oxidase subunit II, partial [Acidiferrobacteraceae bacterium]|nr:cytochrome C oxidase subunit II [Acidiferrobacteraceae bacterium]